MPGLYSITSRATGTVLTAAIYNADHQNHVDNQTPQMTDDYSINAAQMQSTVDPGESGTEVLPTSMAGEIERLRFSLQDLKVNGLGLTSAQWYSTPNKVLTGVTFTNPANTTQALTDAAPTTWDTSLGAIATWTMGASRTLSAPTNLKAGGYYVLRITQDGTGGRQVTWNAVFKSGYSGTMPQPKSTAASVTSFTFESDGTNLYLINDMRRVLDTPQATTSGASFTFTAPAPGVKQAIISYAGVSLTGADALQIQIGPTGGVETSGYLGSVSSQAGTVANATAGMILIPSGGGGSLHHGTVTWTLLDATNNIWTATSMLGLSNAATVYFAGFSKPLAGELAKIKIMTNGADTYDAGSVNVQWVYG